MVGQRPRAYSLVMQTDNAGWDKVVVITGASKGIGEATARELAHRGARVVLGARDRPALDAIVGEIHAAGGQAIAVTCDVTRRDDVRALVDTAVETYGRIDVLVNNAGVSYLGPLSAGKVDEWERTVDVNLKGVLFGIAAALPRFQAQGAGHFVNVSSVLGRVAYPMAAVYAATKFAVHGLTEGFRAECGDTIRNTIIAPGMVATNINESTSDPQLAEAMRGIYARAMPPAAVARAIAYAIGEPNDIDVNEILIRPTAQP